MNEPRDVPIGVIGPGRLGATLTEALLEAGYNVKLVGVRGDGWRGASKFKVAATSDLQHVAAHCDLVFLTVPDAAITDVCRSVRWEARNLVVHCSGAAGLDALEPATRAGATPGCLHPLQSFPAGAPETSRFRGIFCGVEGAEPLGGLLEQVASSLGAHPVRLEGVDRALYHAAAVVMSNHVVALASAATRLWALAGLPEGLGRQALSPLLLATAGNVSRLDLTLALTGPVARGDVATVEAHLRALQGDPSLLDLYRRLSAELLRLPLPHNPATARRLRDLLAD